jgi:hypothetical protein
MAYRKRPPVGVGRERHALPPLWDKEVELVSVTDSRVRFSAGGAVFVPLWEVHLLVNGEPYRIKLTGKDELDVMRRIMTMRDKKPRSPFHE